MQHAAEADRAAHIEEACQPSTGAGWPFGWVHVTCVHSPAWAADAHSQRPTSSSAPARTVAAIHTLHCPSLGLFILCHLPLREGPVLLMTSRRGRTCLSPQPIPCLRPFDVDGRVPVWGSGSDLRAYPGLQLEPKCSLCEGSRPFFLISQRAGFERID